jgi:hypothetical protein
LKKSSPDSHLSTRKKSWRSPFKPKSNAIPSLYTVCAQSDAHILLSSSKIQNINTHLSEQSHEFLELALEAWARNLARVISTTRTESTRLSEVMTTVLESERQQGMSASLILSNSARPRRTAFQFCADFLGMQHVLLYRISSCL